MPANPPPAQLLPVIQADRDAAAAYMDRVKSKRWSVDGILSGGCDNTSIVQSFAAHRLAHSPERGELASLVEASGRLLAALELDYPDRVDEADTAPVEHFGECGETALTFGHIRDVSAALHALSASPEGEG